MLFIEIAHAIITCLCKQVIHLWGRLGSREEKERRKEIIVSVSTLRYRDKLISLSYKSGGWYDFYYTDEKNYPSESIYFKFMHTDFSH